MRTYCAALSVIVVISSGVFAADATADAKAILEKAIKAHGGADKLSKIKGESWKVQGEMVAGDQAMKYTGEYTFAGPSSFRFDIAIEIGEDKGYPISAATDGKAAWEKAGDVVQDMEAKKRGSFDHNVYTMSLGHLTVLNDKAFTLAPLGESKHENQTLVGIKASREGQRDVSLYFDKATGLLTKTSTTNFDPDFTQKDITQDVYYTGYKDKDGVKTFDKLTIFRDGKKFISEEFSEHKCLDKVEPAKFAKPKD